MTDYISLKVILDNCLAHPLLKDLTFERAVVYAVDFIRIMGMPPMFIEKTEEIEIRNHRGALPCDFHEMIQVRTKRRHHKCHDREHSHVMRYSTDSFHMSHMDDKHRHFMDEHTDPTYKIQGRVIFTSMKEGKIEIAYSAIAVDDEGYPLIPDNSSFTKALELYIKKQCFTVLFDLGKIQQGVLQNTQQEYAFYAG